MTKDEIITAITGLLPYPQINNSLLAVRIANDIYDLFKEHYVPEEKKVEPVLLQLTLTNCFNCEGTGVVSNTTCLHCNGTGKLVLTGPLKSNT